MGGIPSVGLLFPPLFPAAVADGCYAALPALAAFLRTSGVRVSVLDLNRRFLSDLLDTLGALSLPPGDPLAPPIRFLRRAKITSLGRHHLDLLVALAEVAGLLPKPGAIDWCSEASQSPFLEFATKALAAALSEPIDLLAISLASFDQLPCALASVRAARQLGLARSVVLGGPAVTLCPDDVLDRLLSRANVDWICRGIGEDILLALARAPREMRRILPDADFAARAGPTDLDHLPTPDFSDVPEAALSGPDATLPLRFAAGCVWGRCTFCDSRRLQPRPVFRNARLVAADLDLLVQRHGVRRFQLIGDTLPAHYGDEFAEAIRARSLDIEWWSYLRVDPAFDRQRLERFASAGCRQVTLGVESTVPRIQARMDKGYPIEDVEPMIDRLIAAGISPKINLIFDFPGQTWAEARQDFQFAERILDRIDQLAAFPFVLSQWSRIAQDPHSYDLASAEPDRGTNRVPCHKTGPHLLNVERTSGMTRDEARAIGDSYGRLRLRSKRCRAICAELCAPDFAWFDRRFAVRPTDLATCPASRRVFNGVLAQVHQLNETGWALLERLLAPGESLFAELCAVSVAMGALPAEACATVKAFLVELAGIGLLHVTGGAPRAKGVVRPPWCATPIPGR